MTDEVTGAEVLAMRARLRDEGRLMKMSDRDGLVLQDILSHAEVYLAALGEHDRFWATLVDAKVKAYGR